METKNIPPFEIGLVMAGAVSAGAYTAGVMDYLLEVLEIWQKEKEKGNMAVPQHDILIKVMTGASAGGMTTAITVAELLRDKTPACKSYMYQAWVKEIDITKLLGTKDLAASDGIKSLFDATAIDAIANEVIHAEHPPKWKAIPYIDPELKLYLTLSNLRGLPYEFKLKGQTGFPYGMTDHSDYQYIEISEKTTQADWTKLRNAAIATGAFPIGLSSRLIKRDTNEYKTRIAKDGRDISGLLKIENNENEPYHFVAVDGGTLNNEPLELARSVWEKFSKEEKEKMDSFQDLQQVRTSMRAMASKKDYALILIDPFPDLADVGKNATEKDTGLLNILGPIVGAMRAQSLFKMEELLRAGDSDNKDSYLVAPIRYTDTNTKALNAIACGFFAGFGGFLAEEFREHDYQLGRRNCQRFLDRYFIIKEEEAKAKGWTIKEEYIVTQDNERHYPIIPIIKESDAAKPQGEKNKWPAYKKMRANNLKDGLTVRVRSVMKRVLPFGWVGSQWVKWTLIILPLLVFAGEFVKAAILSSDSPIWLGGVNNIYILLFQIILLLAFTVLLVLRLGKWAIEKKIIKSAYKMFVGQVKDWGIEVE
jgi:hypothetical protein